MNPKEFEDILNLQRNMSKRLVTEAQVDNKIKVINLIMSMGKKQMLVEELLLEAENLYLSEQAIMDSLESLAEDNTIKLHEGKVIYNS